MHCLYGPWLHLMSCFWNCQGKSSILKFFQSSNSSFHTMNEACERSSLDQASSSSFPGNGTPFSNLLSVVLWFLHNYKLLSSSCRMWGTFRSWTNRWTNRIFRGSHWQWWSSQPDSEWIYVGNQHGKYRSICSRWVTYGNTKRNPRMVSST